MKLIARRGASQERQENTPESLRLGADGVLLNDIRMAENVMRAKN